MKYSKNKSKRLVPELSVREHLDKSRCSVPFRVINSDNEEEIQCNIKQLRCLIFNRVIKTFMFL